MGTRLFLRAYFKNLLWDALGAIPGLGVVSNALKETFAEFEAAADRVDEVVKAELAEVSRAQTDELRLGIERTGLPAPSGKSLSQDSPD